MKRNLAVAALLVIIIACVVVIARKLMGNAAPTAPDWVMRSPEEKIDEKTLEIMTKTKAEWEKVSHHKYRWKNPKTGEYTLADVQICGSCKAKIPSPDFDSSGKSYMETLKTYVCPKCKKPVFPQLAGLPEEGKRLR